MGGGGPLQTSCCDNAICSMHATKTILVRFEGGGCARNEL